MYRSLKCWLFLMVGDNFPFIYSPNCFFFFLIFSFFFILILPKSQVPTARGMYREMLLVYNLKCCRLIGTDTP
jgi:hypothetical protein